jgi:hypothetical protein
MSSLETQIPTHSSSGRWSIEDLGSKCRNNRMKETVALEELSGALKS